jgi:hypothetical protein
MECASDTESDSSGPLSPGTITESIKECAVLQKANPRVLSFEAVERAIEILGARDVALSSIVEVVFSSIESSLTRQDYSCRINPSFKNPPNCC